MGAFMMMIIGVSTVKAESEYVNYNGIVMSEQEISNLKSLAFSDDEIFLMDLEEFNNNKNLTGEIVAVDKKYYKTILYYNNQSLYSLEEQEPYYWTTVEVTQEEYENSDNTMTPFGVCPTVSTEYKILSSEIVKLGTNKFRYKADLTWKKMPKTRSYDVMSIGIEPDLYVASDSYYRTNISRDDKNKQATIFEQSKTCTWNDSAEGAIVTFKLPADEPNRNVVGISSHMYFTIGKRTGTTIKALNSYSSYRHAQKKVSADISASVSFGKGWSISFGITPQISESYDSMPTAHAIYDGLNWK